MVISRRNDSNERRVGGKHVETPQFRRDDFMPIAREKVPSADPPSPQAIEVPANNRLPLNRQQLTLLRIEFPQADSRANSDRSHHFFRAPRPLPASSGAQEISKSAGPYCQAFPWSARRWRASSVSPASHLQASVDGAVLAARRGADTAASRASWAQALVLTCGAGKRKGSPNGRQ